MLALQVCAILVNCFMDTPQCKNSCFAALALRAKYSETEKLKVSSLHFVFELWKRHFVTYIYLQANISSADMTMLFFCN